MDTVVREQYKSEVFESQPGLSGDYMAFEIEGQTVERSFEDRSVYVHMRHLGDLKDTEDIFWFRAEDAIELGEMLCRHGRKALVANMVNHQLLLCDYMLEQYVREGRIKSLLFTVLDRKPANHGKGFILFKIIPQWVKGKSPKYARDFTYEKVIYWSPTPEDFKVQKERYGVPVKFVDYDHSEVMADFKRNLESFK